VNGEGDNVRAERIVKKVKKGGGQEKPFIMGSERTLIFQLMIQIEFGE
jgi:hypothetical protein